MKKDTAESRETLEDSRRTSKTLKHALNTKWECLKVGESSGNRSQCYVSL